MDDDFETVSKPSEYFQLYIYSFTMIRLLDFCLPYLVECQYSRH